MVYRVTVDEVFWVELFRWRNVIERVVGFMKLLVINVQGLVWLSCGELEKCVRSGSELCA